MSIPFHPPAAGGKTAWGGGDLISKTGEDTEELQRRRKVAAEFNEREQSRLNNLKVLDKQGLDIIEERRQRKENWEKGLRTGTADDFKNRQLEILQKLEENKAQRKLEKKERLKIAGADSKEKVQKKKVVKKDAKKTKKKKKKESSSSSSSSGSSSSSSSGSSSGDKGNEKKRKAAVQGELIPLPKAPQLSPEQQAEMLAAKRRSEEAKAKDKEMKRNAKAMLAAHEAEMKQKAAADQSKYEADARRKAAEAQSKKNEEAKAKAEAEAAKKAAEEVKTAEAEARKKACQEAMSKVKSGKVEAQKNVRDMVAGGFFIKQHVLANKDITIRGTLVVRNGTAGTILGKADTDPVNRIAVKFVPRADGGTASINCVPIEIRKG